MPFLTRPEPQARQFHPLRPSASLAGKMGGNGALGRFGRAALLPLLLLPAGGCSSSFFGSGTPAQPRGGVVADEPRAVVAGRDVLNAGGSAADAAVATYFALSVTMPTVAGLGGGGVCLSWEAASGRAEVIDFLPRPTAGGNMTVPSNVRGMALLHARSGKLRWEQTMGAAEAIARFGQPLSRAAAQGLSAADPQKIGPDAYEIFTGGSGRMPVEGGSVRQLQLAAVLARIRAAGAGDFYVGQVAHELVANIGRAFGDLTLDDLRDRVPELARPLAVDLRESRIYLTPPPGSGGAVAADLLAMLAYARYSEAQPQARPHILAEAVRRATAAEERRIAGEAGEIGTPRRAADLLADFQPTRANDGGAVRLPANVTPPATGLVTNDADGNAVACSFTMLATLGTGQMIANSGIVTAPPPPPTGIISMLPALVTNSGSSAKLRLALAASGGAPAPAAAASTILGIRALNQPAEAALGQARLYAPGGGVMLEPEAGDSAEALKAVGHQLLPPSSIGRVNVISCPDGTAERCSYVADPRGAGLGARRS